MFRQIERFRGTENDRIKQSAFVICRICLHRKGFIEPVRCFFYFLSFRCQKDNKGIRDLM